MSLVAATSVAAVAQAPHLGTYTLMGKPVAAVLPPEEPVNADRSEDFKGWKYDFKDGRLIGRHLGNGPWDELRQLYTAKSATPVADWKAKFVLFDRTDILDYGSDGVLRERRSGFFGPDTKHILESIALLGSMIEAYSGGKLRFVPSVEVEGDMMPFDAPREVPYGAKFAEDYFRSRINAGAFVPDEKVDVGPYNSVFFIHSGLTKTDAQGAVNDTPFNGFAFYYDYDAVRPGQLARRMFNAWISHLIYAADRHGYQLGEMTSYPGEQFQEDAVRLRLPEGLITDEMWAQIANLKDTSDYALHYPTHFGEGKKPWEEVRSSPWILATKLDAPSLVPDRAEKEDRWNGNHTAGLISNDPRLVWCEPEFSEFVANSISTAGNPTCEGYFGGPLLQFSGPSTLELGISDVSDVHGIPTARISFKDADPKMPMAGDFSYSIISDPAQGAVAHVAETWVVRSGWLKLDTNTDPNGQYSGFDMLVHPGNGSFGIDFTDGTSKTQEYELFGLPKIAADESNEAVERHYLQLDPGGGWQHVSIPGIRYTNAYLTAGEDAEWPLDLNAAKPSIDIAGIALWQNTPATALVSDTPLLVPSITASSDPDSVARFCAQSTPENYKARITQLLPLFKAQDSTILVNIANVYTRVKDKGAEDQLGALAKSLDPRVAQIACRALAFQGTDTARGELLDTLQNGPFDANKTAAAEALAPQKDENLLGLYSDMITSQIWHGRLAAVEAVAQIGGPKAQGVLRAFLEETNPQIVYTVAGLADTSQPDTAARMEWYSVNDPYDTTRAACAEALLRSTLPGYYEEGLKALQDDSYLVRELVLAYLQQHPDARSRNAVLACLRAPYPEVRAQALATLSAIQQPVTPDDLSPVKTESDPRAQRALLDLAKDEKIKLAPETIAALVQSPDPQISKEAKLLGS